MLDCVGWSPFAGINVTNTITTTPARISRCLGMGAPGIAFTGTGSVYPGAYVLIAENNVAVCVGNAYQAQYGAAFLFDSSPTNYSYALIRHTLAIAGKVSGNYSTDAFRGGQGYVKADFVRNVVYGLNAATLFNVASTYTNNVKLGVAETNWPSRSDVPFGLLPIPYSGTSFGDSLAHLAGLAGESAFDLLGFDRSASSQTQGPVEYEAGKRVVGYPGYKSGRGIAWMGDLVGGGAFPTVGGSIVRGGY